MDLHTTKTVIKSLKLGLKNRFESLGVVTEEVIQKLKTCVSEFDSRVKGLLEINNNDFVPMYDNLISDFEKYQKILFFTLASFDSSSENSNSEIADNSKITVESNSSSSIQNTSSSKEHVLNKYVPLEGENIGIDRDENFPTYNSVVPGAEYSSNSSVSSSVYCSISSGLYETIPKASSILIPSETANSDTLCKEVYQQSEEEVRSVPASVIQIPSVLSAMLTHIVSPDDFWMKLENSFENKLQFHSSILMEESPSIIKQGDFCLAPFKNHPSYYRAKVLKKISTDAVEVLFIDHGDTQLTNIKDLKALPHFSYQIPMQAIHCCLYGVSPTKVWCPESVEKFEEYQLYKFETHIKEIKDQKFAVQLNTKITIDDDEEIDCDIAQVLSLHSSNREDSTVPESPRNEISNNTSCDSGVSITSHQRLSPDVHINAQLNVHPFKQSQQQNGPPEELYSSDSFESAEKVPGSTMKYCTRKEDCDCWLHLVVPPPSLSLVNQDLLVVLMGHIVSPREFYVNPAMEDSAVLDELREQMTLTYETQLPYYLIPLQDLREGMYCAAVYERDKSWYRVKILKIQSKYGDSCPVFVQYIDYGDTALVNVSDMRLLKPEFAQHPVFAVKCSLAGVMPNPEDHPKNQETMPFWSKGAIEKFREVTSCDRVLTAQVLSREVLEDQKKNLKILSSEPLDVLLWADDTSEELVNAVLAECGVAFFNTNVLIPLQQQSEQKPKEDSLQHWDPMAQDFNAIENSYGVDTDDVQVAISGYKANDDKYICKYFAACGFCPRKYCSFEHVRYAEGGVTRDQILTYCLDTSPLLPDPSVHVLLQISAVVSPGMFYALLYFGDKSVDEVDRLVRSGTPSAELMKSESFEVTELFGTMNTHYNNAPFSENINIALAFGDIVAAFRRADQSWHRGRVVDYADLKGLHKIFFVDFGCEEFVPRSLIRQIQPRFLHTSFRAVECHLSGVEPLGCEKGNKWSDLATVRFNELTCMEVLLANVILRCGKVLHVTLRKTTALDHSCIGETLVREGFAQYYCAPTAKKPKSTGPNLVPG